MADCYKKIQRENLHFVVDVDIKDFFDNVSHSKLVKQMWNLGIRDKKLLCIIKEMLKAPVVLPDGKKIFPEKGTPQGGILSPLLSNIVLNELDWWAASQWENLPTRHLYKAKINYNGSLNQGSKYRELKKTCLKEMWIVRYADDFKLFCRKRSDADKVFWAVKKWLKDRLGLEVSEEKSKVVNLKRNSSEFLGLKLKAAKKSGKYVVNSNMCDKAIERATKNLVGQVKLIQKPGNPKEEWRAVTQYNSIVIGLHNYYKMATNISLDMAKNISKRRYCNEKQVERTIKKIWQLKQTQICEGYLRTK